MTAGSVQLRWDRASQHRAFLAGLGLLDRAPTLTLDVLLALHTVLLPPSNPYCGHFRDSPIQIRFNGVTHWQPPAAAEAIERTADTLARITLEVSDGRRGEPMKTAAARAWFEITDLHPFADGNGRVARSVASWMLIRGGYALLMDPGLYCHPRRVAYFRALDSKVLDPRPWRTFFDGIVEYCFRKAPE
jgi:Fic family protein